MSSDIILQFIVWYFLKEPSKTAALLGIIANAVDQVFLPVEKALWLHEVGVLKFDEKTADRLDVFSTGLWATSLYISLLQ